MEEKQVNYWIEYLTELGEEYLPKIAAAVLVLIIGWYLIDRINRAFRSLMVKKEVEVSLVPFIGSLINFLLKILLLVSVASMVGIATTSFVAVLGAASLAIGLALQGSLSNFAGGVLILFFRPFKVGDLIESEGIKGVVQSITVLNTVLITAADNTAILPNSQVANNKILNFTRENNRRVDLTVGIGYDEDVVKAKAVILEALLNTPKVLNSPEPFVGILGFGNSSVDLAVRPFCKSVDYWEVYFAANEAIKDALDKHNIEIPYPHQVEIKK